MKASRKAQIWEIDDLKQFFIYNNFWYVKLKASVMSIFSNLNWYVVAIFHAVVDIFRILFHLQTTGATVHEPTVYQWITYNIIIIKY